MPKKYDIAAKCGTYTNKYNEAKNRYASIGEIHAGQDGHYARFDALKLLGMCHLVLAKGEDSFIASLFEPRVESVQPQQQPSTQRPAYDKPSAPFDDADIPF